MDQLHLSSHPLVAFIGFLRAGVGGILVLPTLQWHDRRGLTCHPGLGRHRVALHRLCAGFGHILDFAHYIPPKSIDNGERCDRSPLAAIRLRRLVSRPIRPRPQRSWSP